MCTPSKQSDDSEASAVDLNSCCTVSNSSPNAVRDSERSEREPLPEPRRSLTKQSNGIPYQYREAMRQGKSSKLIREWYDLGMPKSLRLERRARRNPLLEEVQNKSPYLPEPNRSVLKIVPHQCDRQTCPHCRKRIGTDIKHSMMDRVRELQNQHGKRGAVRMWTLTVDRSKWNSPEHAHREISRLQSISRLADKIGWTYWVAVVEWHKDEEGWPHYHVLVWTPNLQKNPKTKKYVYPYESHTQVQNTWRHGYVQYQDTDLSRGQTIQGAIRYVTDYITKTERSPAPDWLLKSKNVRLIRSSSDWGATRSRRSSRRRHSLFTRDAGADREPNRTNLEAMADCGKSCTMLETYLDTDTGEIKTQFVKSIPLTWRDIKKFMSRAGPNEARQSFFSIQAFDTDPIFKRLIRLINRVSLT